MAARKNAKKEIAEVAQFSETMPAYMNPTSHRGSENVSSDDLTIPRLSLIQDLSPQRKKSDPEYIDGAEEGMFFNTVSKELYGESVTFIPCFFTKEWNIWKTVKAGGGFCGSFATQEEAEAEFANEEYANKVDKEGNCEYEIVDTAQHYGLVLHEDRAPEEIVISMTKSKMKVNRNFNSMIRLNGGDRFSRAYKITSVPDQNSAGQDYLNMKIAPLGFVSEEVYHAGEKLYESVATGVKKAARDSAE